jgi:hypothetical protein
VWSRLITYLESDFNKKSKIHVAKCVGLVERCIAGVEPPTGSELLSALQLGLSFPKDFGEDMELLLAATKFKKVLKSSVSISML